MTRAASMRRGPARGAVLLAAISLALAEDNGKAITPPLGWRNWNQYQCGISSSIMEATFRVLATYAAPIWNGSSKTLLQLGYSDAGLDDCYQACGSYGPEKYTYHDPANNLWPAIDPVKFPGNMSTMTAVAHSLGLTVGFYANNCACADHCKDPACFAADVDFIIAMGFDGVKLDGCGKEERVEIWRDLLNFSSPKPILIENCHNGPNEPSRDAQGTLWCPFHQYRSSTDIRPVFGSILANLQSIPPLAAANLSVPGCWAYPDSACTRHFLSSDSPAPALASALGFCCGLLLRRRPPPPSLSPLLAVLEVGVTNTQDATQVPLNHSEARAHFGAWAIVSAPLVLGLNLTDAPTLAGVWDIITNTEAIAVNQEYAGASGTIFYSSADQTAFAPCGWWLPNCTFPTQQFLYKPLSGGDVAVLLMNNGVAPADIQLTLASIPGWTAGGAAVRDIWAHSTLPPVRGALTAKAVGARDSVFFRLTPQA